MVPVGNAPAAPSGLPASTRAAPPEVALPAPPLQVPTSLRIREASVPASCADPGRLERPWIVCVRGLAATGAPLPLFRVPVDIVPVTRRRADVNESKTRPNAPPVA